MKNLRYLLFYFVSTAGTAQTPAPLPPTMEWHGNSEKLVRPNTDPWITPAEKGDFRFTATRSETDSYFQRLAKLSPLLSVHEAGKSSGGLSIPLIILSKEIGFHTAPRTKKPILLVQCGIHAGEIDGKDASMMFARDVVLQKNDLLNDVNILIVPIFNVEGHERTSPYNRMNQRGPENMGWRTNGRNLNLNRDYMKAETGEMQSMIALINKYDPSLYLDIHVTDGADYQYDITYGFIGNHGYSPTISNWLTANFRTYVDAGLATAGHIPGPLLFAKNGENFKDGNLDYTFNPDFSHAYGDAVHVPTVLVENHSLKPFKQRVLGTYVLIESAVKLLSKEKRSLQRAISADKAARPTAIGVNWVFDKNTSNTATDPWKADNQSAISTRVQTHLGVASETMKSTVTGSNYQRFTGQKENFNMPVFQNNTARDTIRMPKAYAIPVLQNELIDKIKLHNIPFTALRRDSAVVVSMYVFDTPVFATSPFEGRFKVAATGTEVTETQVLPEGSIIIKNDQPKFTLAALLLEPQSPSSLFQWGFNNAIFNRTEYIEAYAMEPYMQHLLGLNAAVKKAFDEKMKDTSFANNPRKIFDWFYGNSPFMDSQYKKYPVYRIF